MTEHVIREAAVKETKAAISFDFINDNLVQTKLDGFMIEYLLDLIRKSEVGKSYGTD